MLQKKKEDKQTEKNIHQFDNTHTEKHAANLKRQADTEMLEHIKKKKENNEWEVEQKLAFEASG